MYSILICLALFFMSPLRSVNAEELTVNECRSRYSARHLSVHRRTPALLYSFPGAGNTWTRILIEHASGVFSGSVYTDESLIDDLPGESECSLRMSVIKAHPHTHSAADLFEHGFTSDFNKCKRGKVHKFEKVVLLVRDPFDSIWSEYQRRLSSNHVGHIAAKDFDWMRWTANAARLAYLYNEMWDKHNRYVYKRIPGSKVLVVKYEDLLDETLGAQILSKIITFLDLDNPAQLHAGPSGSIDKVVADDRRVRCAFLLSNSGTVNRHKGSSISHSIRQFMGLSKRESNYAASAGRTVGGLNRAGSGKRLRGEVEHMTKQHAYPVELACRMWNVFSNYAMRLNYTLPAGIDENECQDYPKIDKFDLGSTMSEFGRQEIDGKVVTYINNEAAKLVDYRGKDKSYAIDSSILLQGLPIAPSSSSGGAAVTAVISSPKKKDEMTWAEKMEIIQKRLAVQNIEAHLSGSMRLRDGSLTTMGKINGGTGSSMLDALKLHGNKRGEARIRRSSPFEV